MQLAQPPSLAAAIFMVCFWCLAPVFLKKYYTFVPVKNKGHRVQRCPTFITMQTQEFIFFTANIILITVSVYSCIIKWFFRPKAYRKHFNRLFPGQFWVGLLFLLQLLEIPYMFEIENVKALRYANAFSLLLSPPVMLIICRKYFFPKQPQPKFEKVMFLPALLLFVVFLLRVTGVLVLSETGKAIVIWGAFAVFLVFFAMTVNMGVKIKKLADGVDYLEYSDSVDFSHTFGNYVMRIPTLICIVAAINYLFNDPWVKFFSDIFSTIMTVAFVLYTLDPWREIEFVEEKRAYNEIVEASEGKSKRRMSDARFEALRDELLKLFEEKEIFLTPQLSLDVLLKELSTNRNYLGETIARCGYKSFYDMVNSYRVKYAIALIKEEPQIKMVEVAYRSGFASATSMNKAFASQGMAVPSQHRNIATD